MKKVILSLVILASITLSANAQKRGHADRKDGLGLPAKELNLSDEQVKEIKSLNSEYKTQIFALRSDSSLTKEQRREKVEELRDGQKLATNKVLTADQQSKLTEMRGRKMKGDKPQRPYIPYNGPRNPNMADPLKDLNLTEDQQKQIVSLNESYRDKTKADKQAHREAINNILTLEQRSQLASTQEKGCKMGKHGKQMHKHHKGSVNDPETNQKLEALKVDFLEKKKAVEMSRIAPEEQTRQIDLLKKRYMEERIEIKKNAKKADSANS